MSCQQEVKNSPKGMLMLFLTCSHSRRHHGSSTSLPPSAATVTAAVDPRSVRDVAQLLQPALLLLPVAVTIAAATVDAAAIDGARFTIINNQPIRGFIYFI